MRVPVATYRIQLNKDVRFEHARALVPYLQRLGVTDLYVSPIFKARAGSTHGYDVTDPTVLNPELGTEEDLDALVAALREHGMGLLVDIVPNHMAVSHESPWWWDVLAKGERSPFAKVFDVTWKTRRRALAVKVLLPVLGASYGTILEKGELKVEAGQLRYWDRRFPLSGDVPEEPTADALDALLRRQAYRLAHWKTASPEINYRRFFD
ncbi:MAG: alpha-amylase family glycosyl hydrolase, partial [Planctomycetota bacterium]